MTKYRIVKNLDVNGRSLFSLYKNNRFIAESYDFDYIANLKENLKVDDKQLRNKRIATGVVALLAVITAFGIGVVALNHSVSDTNNDTPIINNSTSIDNSSNDTINIDNSDNSETSSTSKESTSTVNSSNDNSGEGKSIYEQLSASEQQKIKTEGVGGHHSSEFNTK